MIFDILAQHHIAALAPLYVETYNAPPWNDEWTILLAMRKIEELVNGYDSFGLVCYNNEGNLAGMIAGASETYFSCRQFYIKDYFVIPSCQGKGIGSALMREFENRLRGMGISKTYLFTSRTEQTEGFYKRRGYNSWNGLVMMGKTLTE